MDKHPCEDGLTAACFKAYPKWARRALSYKLLHLILPKQISRMLPRMTMPPGFVWRGNWNTWLSFIYAGYDFPWEYFPEEWRIGDDLPPGVVIPPEILIPALWPPPPPPPPEVIIPPIIIKIPGWPPPPPPPEPPEPPEPPPPPPPRPRPPVEPPIIVIPPWWPPRRPPTQPLPFDIGELLREQGPGNAGYAYGDLDSQTKLAGGQGVDADANVAGIYVKVGKVGSPADNVRLEIWDGNLPLNTGDIITGGTSTAKSAAGLPVFAVDQDWVLFIFPDKPFLSATLGYHIAFARSGSVHPSNYLKVVGLDFPWGRSYYQNELGIWGDRLYVNLDFKVYGFPT